MILKFLVNTKIFNKTEIDSWFSRKCTARGSSTGLCRIGPPKVKASKSILFTDGSSEVKKIRTIV